MIATYEIIKVEDKYTCVNKDNDYAEIVGGVFTSPTAAFYYSLKELDANHEGPFVVEYFKTEEKDDNGKKN